MLIEEFRGRIGRSIVHYDNFKVSQSLPLQMLEAQFQSVDAIEGRNDETCLDASTILLCRRLVYAANVGV